MLRWVFLSQPMRAPEEGEAARPAPVDRPSAGPRDSAALPEPRPAREPELAFAGARARPRNLTFNDPGAVLSGSASALGAAAAAEPSEAHGGMSGEVQTVRREGKKVGRNDPCPCGSGRKYKKCHGA
jgi:SEC-C motif